MEVSRDVEVVLWFFAAFCSSLPGESAACCAAASAVWRLVPQLPAVDQALPPWRGLLWSSVCGLATAVNRRLADGMPPLLRLEGVERRLVLRLRLEWMCLGAEPQ